MPAFINKIAYFLSKKFLKDDLDLVCSKIRWIHDGGTTYNSEANPILAQAIMLAEDRSFGSHPGFHVRGILRAAYVYLTRRHVQGASTIEQQLIRVIRNRYEITFKRKLSEIILATALAVNFTKTDVLECYLEIAYFGWRATGIRRVCRRLNIEVNMMRPAEAAHIAALIKIPLPKNPSIELIARIKKRSEYIQFLMRKESLL